MCLGKERKISFLLGIHLISSYIPFTLSYPILPMVMERKAFPVELTGIILGVFSLPTLLLSFSFNKMVHFFGRRCIYLSGLYMITVAVICFGIIEYSDSLGVFVSIGVLSRLLVGMGMFQTKTVIFSITAKRFPDKREINKMFTYIGIWINVAVGIGQMLGEILFEALGQNILYPQLVVAALNFIVFLPLGHYMLTQKNMTPLSQQENATVSTPPAKQPHRVQTQLDETVVPVCAHLKSLKVIVLYMVIFWNVSYQYYWWSSLAVELRGHPYNATSTQVGIAYLLRSIFFFPPAFFVPKILDRIGNIWALMIANIVHTVSQVFFGPSYICGLPQNIYLIYTGIALMGLIGSLHFAPVFPEIIKDFQQKHRKYQIGPISDVVSAIGNTVVQVGAITGSVMGMVLSTRFSFRGMVDFFFLLQIPMLLLYILFSGVLKENCKSAKKTTPIQRTDPPSSARRMNVKISKEEGVSD